MKIKTTDQKIDGLTSGLNQLTAIVKDGFAKTEAGFTKISQEADQKIDNLAQMIAGGFEQVDKQFLEARQQLDKIESSVNHHDRRIENLEDRMRQVATKLTLKFN